MTCTRYVVSIKLLPGTLVALLDQYTRFIGRVRGEVKKLGV